MGIIRPLSIPIIEFGDSKDLLKNRMFLSLNWIKPGSEQDSEKAIISQGMQQTVVGTQLSGPGLVGDR
jgi:hypothetical protein